MLRTTPDLLERVYQGKDVTPFREYKHLVPEGGIATPLIAHWPQGIAARGELRSQPGQLPDIMATCLDVAGAKYPAEFRGQAITPLEGRSLVPAFANQPVQRDGLFWEHEGNAAVRVGDLKLVRMGGKGAWELYDLKADRTELKDLANATPEKVKELADKWEAWAKRAQVIPGLPQYSGTGGTNTVPAKKKNAKKKAQSGP